ncbi:hypothetical protein CHISP_0894 [Chitinispirillum alkaliphilum]|nr:hypothetical protein CHISP_0894 [Chitinispirillum alkaliphilum]
MRIILTILAITTLTAGQTIPVPLEDGEGTRPSGVTISGTPPGQIRLTTGYRTQIGDERPFSLLSGEISEESMVLKTGDKLAEGKIGWGFGVALETSVQNPFHFSIGFDGQYGTFDYVSFSIGAGYNYQLISNKLWAQVKSDFLLGKINFELGNLPDVSGNTNILGSTFTGKNINTTISAGTIMVRPELNIFLRLRPRGLLMFGSGYQLPLSKPEFKVIFEGKDISNEEISENTSLTSSEVSLVLDEKKVNTIDISPKGLVLSISWIFEL